MKWTIPAKTFFLGEYAALAEASAIILTTNPCFELTLSSSTEHTTSKIHPQSPAGIWWEEHRSLRINRHLIWEDPYQGCGGLGASSAQFLSTYLATCFIQETKPTLGHMLNAYYHCAWQGKGIRPSGYDVLAQSQEGCVYINKQNKQIQSFNWPFKDLSLFLIHTGLKLATHHHLQNLSPLPHAIHELSALVDEAKQAFELVDSQKIIWAINCYHQKLAEFNLIAQHSLTLIDRLKAYAEIVAMKGCGALGADVLLIITLEKDALKLCEQLKKLNLNVLATEKNIYSNEQKIFDNVIL